MYKDKDYKDALEDIKTAMANAKGPLQGSLGIIQEAVDKQIPVRPDHVKVIMVYPGWHGPHNQPPYCMVESADCPVCGHHFVERDVSKSCTKPRHCSACGQALRWDFTQAELKALYGSGLLFVNPANSTDPEEDSNGTK